VHDSKKTRVDLKLDTASGAALAYADRGLLWDNTLSHLRKKIINRVTNTFWKMKL
jgi:hypothetical protein